MPELGPSQSCAQYMGPPPAIENFELTGVGHLRRPKNAMDEGEDVLCCFFTSGWGCGDDWLAEGVCLGVWEFRGPNAESGVSGPPCSDELLDFDASTLALDTIQNDCSVVVNSLCAGSTCRLLYTLFSLS